MERRPTVSSVRRPGEAKWYGVVFLGDQTMDCSSCKLRGKLCEGLGAPGSIYDNIAKTNITEISQAVIDEFRTKSDCKPDFR